MAIEVEEQQIIEKINPFANHIPMNRGGVVRYVVLENLEIAKYRLGKLSEAVVDGGLRLVIRARDAMEEFAFEDAPLSKREIASIGRTRVPTVPLESQENISE